MAAEKSLNITKNWRKFLQEYLVLVGIVLLVLITIIVEPKFMSEGNLTNILRQFGPLSLVALGMTFVIIGGFIDLSVAGIISLVGVVTVSLIDPLGQTLALIIGLLLGVVCGLFTSTLLITSGALTQAEALFITFGSSQIYLALALMITGGKVLNLRHCSGDYSLFTAIGKNSLGPIPISFIIFLFSLAVLYVFQSKTAMGRTISLSGGNKTAAKLTGLPVNTSIMVIYAICGFMAAFGAINQFSRSTSAAPTMGAGFETNAIMSVVVGGTTLKGGRGSVLRTVLGTLLIILMSNCLNLLGVSTYMQNVTKGAILVIAIWLDNRKEQ